MSYENFLKGIAILMGYGLEEKDKWELDLWWGTLEKVSICGRKEKGIKPEEYLSAVEHMCEREGNFWVSLNVPARIISIVEEQVESKKQNAFRDRMLLAGKKELEEDEKLKQSWGGTEEERLRNQQKVKKMIQAVYL